MREIQLNMYHALALGAVMYWLGAALTRKLPALRRFCVPAPLVGGLCFALFNTRSMPPVLRSSPLTKRSRRSS